MWDPVRLTGLEGGTINRWSPRPQVRVGDSMVDRDPISGALYSGALALDPPWNTSEVCAGGGGRPSSKKDDLLRQHTPQMCSTGDPVRVPQSTGHPRLDPYPPWNHLLGLGDEGTTC